MPKGESVLITLSSAACGLGEKGFEMSLSPITDASKQVFLVGVHRHSFRRDEPAAVLGVEWYKPSGQDPRACFHIVYSDEFHDYVPVSDTEAYKLVPQSQA